MQKSHFHLSLEAWRSFSTWLFSSDAEAGRRTLRVDAFLEGIPPFGRGHASTDYDILSIFYTPRTIQGKAAWQGTRQTKALRLRKPWPHPAAKWRCCPCQGGQCSGRAFPWLGTVSQGTHRDLRPVRAYNVAILTTREK